MHPAISVILLTTLIGVGQGLFLALYTGQVYSLAHLLEPQDSQSFYAVGSALAAGDSGPRKHAEGRYDASTHTYTVVAGDDLSDIAKRFGTTAGELEKLNKK